MGGGGFTVGDGVVRWLGGGREMDGRMGWEDEDGRLGWDDGMGGWEMGDWEIGRLRVGD